VTRRHFMLTLAAAAGGSAATAPLQVPIYRVMDSRARLSPERLQHFWLNIWPEAVRDFSSGGIALQTTDVPGEVRRSPGDRPVFIGLRKGVLNLVLTDYIPMRWDRGRALAGVTTIYDGYHLCLLALEYVHGNQVPFLSVNTCVHELLHALMQDVFITHPSVLQTGERETRIDWYASWMWLFHDGAAVRKSARAYLHRLQPPSL
jgi:hypothetical protein